jgi:enoyl-CoA hydratase
MVDGHAVPSSLLAVRLYPAVSDFRHPGWYKAATSGGITVSYTTFDLDIADQVAHLKLKRPEAFNSMTLAFWQEIVDGFEEIAVTPAVRAVVISSTGKHFTAGMDLSVFSNVAGNEPKVDRARQNEQLRRNVLEMQQSFSVIEECRVPVIAAIQGGCIGGGVDMISACDIRLCTKDAWFCIQEINIGMVADVGTLQRLPYLIPEGLVRELAYTGRRLMANRALKAGLVNEVYDSQEAMVEAALAMAREIASKSPLAVTGTKEMLNYSRDHSVADGLNHIATWNAGMLHSDDLMEALTAQKQKRQPKFADLLPPRSYVKRRR